MKITVLIENILTEGLSCEHGLSLLIEHGNKAYLLDAGQTDAFMDNAIELGVDLSNVNTAILSHGHYDHAGGFAGFLDKYQDVKVYAMKGITEDYLSSKGGMHSIGMPCDVYPVHKDRFVMIDGVCRIDEEVYLIPHNTLGLDKIGERAGLYRKENDTIVPDDFAHELSLVFDVRGGFVIFNSCSHGGICNIISEVKKTLGNRKILAFVGGLHMMGTQNGEEICTFSDEEIKNIADFLKDNEVESLYIGHCTGLIGYDKLIKEFGSDKVHYLNTGKTITI